MRPTNVIWLVLLLAIGLAGCESGKELQPSVSAGASPSPTARVQAKPVEAMPVTAPARAGSEKTCLDCHGPFDKLIPAAPGYVAPSGEKISPHRYVPHDSKLEKDIPKCSHCHTTHPVSPPPAKGAVDLSKVGVTWCFDCHHNKDFQSCKDCHP